MGTLFFGTIHERGVGATGTGGVAVQAEGRRRSWKVVDDERRSATTYVAVRPKLFIEMVEVLLVITFGSGRYHYGQFDAPVYGQESV